MKHSISKLKNLKVPFILGIIAIILSIIGFILEIWGGPAYAEWLKQSGVIQNILHGLSTVEKAIYKTFQFTQFEYDVDGYGDIIENPFLFLARWLAPIAFFWFAIDAYFLLIQSVRDESKLKKISRWKDHNIVCGYGEVGKRIVKSLAEQEKKVVVIDPCIEKDHFYTSDKKNCILIRQDAKIINSLSRSGFKNARDLIAVTGDDLKNFSILANARSMLESENRQKSLIAFAHVDNSELISIVHDYTLFKTSDNNFDGRVFNADEIAARIVFNEHSPDIYKPIQDVKSPPAHVLIIGFNHFAQSLILQMGFSAHFINDVKTQVTVIDASIDQLKDQFLSRFENIHKTIDLELISDRPECLTNELVAKFSNKESMSAIYLCHQDMTVQTLTLKRIKEIWNYQVDTIVCQSDHVPVPDWVSLDNKFHVIDPFSRACTYDMIVAEKIEKLAESFHRNWLKNERIAFQKKLQEYEEDLSKGLSPKKPIPKPSMVDWSELAEEYKQSNRSQALHLSVKLRTLGLAYCEQDDERPEAEYIDDPELIKHMANMEHRRWNAHLYLTGWNFNKDRDDSLKQHDNLTEWDALTDKIKQYDIDHIIEIPKMLKSVDFNMKICKISMN